MFGWSGSSGDFCAGWERPDEHSPPPRRTMHGMSGMLHFRTRLARPIATGLWVVLLALVLIAGGVLSPAAAVSAEPSVTVHKDPNCGCCSLWIRHLQAAGFTVTGVDTAELGALKTRLGIPSDLAACHTAQVAGYIIEGHVPAAAVKRFLAEKPSAAGLAVSGMPIGSPGMEGGTPEPYDVILFGPAGRRTYMRFLGEKALG